MTKPSKRRFGAYRGAFEVPDSFFDPLPAEELAAFEGEAGDADPLKAASPGTSADPLPVPGAKATRRHRRRKG